MKSLLVLVSHDYAACRKHVKPLEIGLFEIGVFGVDTCNSAGGGETLEVYELTNR